MDHLDDDTVDVRAYLLDPPPTAEARAQQDRRRALVRRASWVAAGLLAIALLAPVPSAFQRDTSPERASAAPASTANRPEEGAESQLPVRVDRPSMTPRRVIRRVPTPMLRVQPHSRATRLPTSSPAPPHRTPPASRPAVEPMPAEGVLVPVA